MLKVLPKLSPEQLVQAREQIQEDLLALIDSDNQQLNNAICQIIVTNFSKFLL